MTLDNLSRGLYLEDVTGAVSPCQATSCGGLADIQGDTTRGVLSSLLPDQRKTEQILLGVASKYGKKPQGITHRGIFVRTEGEKRANGKPRVLVLVCVPT
ncbi:hypothetical protein EYF80_000293 [Liparis tanakae]|uniref:Uncharacterized protein n=1 Tax=Liparis tanakae TaxID=230148 RepID=A0A4Z2JHM8_9TELE|nr:hypothetical protein EYF80_000293 [Liparis tanakae]